MNGPQLGSAPLFELGPLAITGTVVTTWAIMAALAACAWALTRRLAIEPSALQTTVEGVIETIESAVAEVAPRDSARLLPFVGTLWIFLVVANLSSVLPGVDAPTDDLSATAALALLVFLSTHWYGVRIVGVRAYMRHYVTPSPILLPFHLVSEISRTVALAMRLFGNMMSLEMAALLVLLVAGFLVPIPILMLHIVEALVQAYIFGMLALIYISSGIQTLQDRQIEE